MGGSCSAGVGVDFEVTFLGVVVLTSEFVAKVLSAEAGKDQ